MAIIVHLGSSLPAVRISRPVLRAKAPPPVALPVKTADCGCGGHKAEDADAATIEAEWTRLDGMMPEALAAEAAAQGVEVSGKTDTIMALLRKQFAPERVADWAAAS
jgi:hypothetical protein